MKTPGSFLPLEPRSLTNSIEVNIASDGAAHLSNGNAHPVRYDLEVLETHEGCISSTSWLSFSSRHIRMLMTRVSGFADRYFVMSVNKAPLPPWRFLP